MTRFLRSACAVLFALSTYVTFGQLVDVELELVQTHDAPYADADLTGFSTYRLYAVVANSDDFVSAVNGLEDSPLVISTTTSFWQSPFGAAIGSEINAAILGISESAAFDSWVTIGRETSSDPGNAVQPLEASGEEWVGPFEAGGDIVIDGMIGGAWFTLFSGPSENGFPDGDNRVLIGQFTTDGEISGTVNIQVFANGSQENSENYTGFSFGAEEECTAEAGALELSTQECLLNDPVFGPTAFIAAAHTTTPVVPTGYEVAYVLTQGAELVIIDLNTIPAFTANETGVYTIHTFVYPADLDLSIVELGVTTGFDVNGLLIQGGGELCAALDVAGAQFIIEDCPPIEDCITDIPYDILDDCVQQVLASDSFCCEVEWDIVCEETYIGCLEDEFGCISEIPYPLTDECVQEVLLLDPFCCNTEWDIFCEEGYQDCLEANAPCEVTAGELALVSQTCLNAGGAIGAQIVAQQTVAPFVPEGYVVAYVLTQGTELVIVDLGATPEFEVSETGLFTVHTFVYPADLDLSGVELGVTTGFDVNGLLIQGGGELCAALDVAGAQALVEECPPAEGCTDPTACNFDPEATLDDGSCIVIGGGCSAPVPACVTDCDAYFQVILDDSFCCEIEWDELCEEEYALLSNSCAVAVPGCTNPAACNFNPDATEDDGSCVLIGDQCVAAGLPECVTDCDAYNAVITADGFCCNNSWDGLCQDAYDAISNTCLPELGGCTNPLACNFNPAATDDDGSCILIGDGCSVVLPECVTDCDAFDAVIAADGFCCSNTWDGLCQSAYDAISNSCDETEPTNPCEAAQPIACGDAVSGSTIGAPLFTVPFCGTADGNSGKSFYTITGNGQIITADLCNSDFDTKIWVFEGGDCNNLVCVGGNDDFCGLQSVFEWESEIGVEYFIVVGGFGTNEGDYTLEVSCSDVPPVCVEVPACVNIAGEAYSTVIDLDPFCCDTAWDADCQEFYDTLSNSCLNPCEIAEPITCGESVSGSTIGEPGFSVPFCGTGTGSGGTAWFTFTGNGQQITADLCNSNFDTKVWIFEGGNCDNLICVGGNDDFAGCGLQSQFTWDSQVGTEYFIVVGGFGSNQGDYTLDVTCEVIVVPGCTDENACNFNPDANEDDGSCEYLSCCEADAGSIAIDATTCVDEGGSVTASIVVDPNVPDGYVVAYVLTEGPELVIIDLNDAPEFDGLAVGNYTIHTFVYPADLDLSIVEFGVTTGGDVNGLLAQGGGTVCAALDVAGAPFSIDECPIEGCTDENACNYNPDANEDDGSCEYLSCCEAEAGTIIIDSVTCVDEGGNVVAIEIEAPVVPDGYVVAYVLTEGPDLVIIDLNDTPEFDGLAVGDYTIHTFVYPADLDLSIVEFGVTTGGDVNALLAQGGGTVCAALNVAGAPFSIDECPIEGCTDENACNYNPDANEDDGSCEYLSCCEAEAGSIAIESTTCVDEGGNVVATVVDAPAVPEGYVVAYVLTEGPELVIIDLNADPEFDGLTEGSYTIHTFVYPEDLDLSFVEFGVTTGGDVNALLAQGGGTLCAALDVAGAPFDIEACEVEQIFGCTSMDACNYDPAATDDDGSCFFVGDACDDGDPDTINDTIDENCDCVGEPVNIEENFLSALRVYPNPVSNELTIDLGEHFAPVMVTMLDLSGRIVMSEQIVGRGRLNVDHLASGMYVLMLEGDGKRGEVKVMVAR